MKKSLQIKQARATPTETTKVKGCQPKLIKLVPLSPYIFYQTSNKYLFQNFNSKLSKDSVPISKMLNNSGKFKHLLLKIAIDWD